jgi:hypothetical protein
MTKEDKILLIHFVTRTGMYICPNDIHNIHSFIHGYETGRKNKCHFYKLLKGLLSTKYKIAYSNDGVPGQLKRLSIKKSTSEIVTFKKIALEVISFDGLDDKMGKIIKGKIVDLINKIEKDGHPWFNETWKDDWLSFVSINNHWFRQLWNKKELAVIKLMDKEILADNIFNKHQNKTPSGILLKLKDKLDQVN